MNQETCETLLHLGVVMKRIVPRAESKETKFTSHRFRVKYIATRQLITSTPTNTLMRGPRIGIDLLRLMATGIHFRIFDTLIGSFVTDRIDREPSSHRRRCGGHPIGQEAISTGGTVPVPAESNRVHIERLRSCFCHVLRKALP